MLERLLSRLFVMEEINGHERCPTYLYRWELVRLGKWLAVYLHKFVGDDWSLDLHDHPKRFISIGLWGSYVEHYACRLQRGVQHTSNCGNGTRHVPGLVHNQPFDAPWVRTFPATHVHRLSGPTPECPCWTLVIVGRAWREWGFWHFGEWIPWRRYVRGGSVEADARKACP